MPPQIVCGLLKHFFSITYKRYDKGLMFCSSPEGDKTCGAKR